MPKKLKYEVRNPTLTYTIALNNCRCEAKRLQVDTSLLDGHSSMIGRQIRSGQSAILRRYYKLCGSNLLQQELQKLDDKAAEICPENILEIDGIMLASKPEPKPPPNPVPEFRSKRRELQIKTLPSSDLGEVNQKGLVEIDPDYKRPLYPWETQAGMLWIKSLGSTLRNKCQSSGGFPSLITKLASKISSASQQGQSDHPTLPNEKTHSSDHVKQAIDSVDALAAPLCPSRDSQLSVEGSIQGERIRFGDIENVIASYESQHRKLFIRNKYKSKRWEASVKYDVLYIEENLSPRKLCRRRVQSPVNQIKPADITDTTAFVKEQESNENSDERDSNKNFLQLKLREYQSRKRSQSGVSRPALATSLPPISEDV